MQSLCTYEHNETCNLYNASKIDKEFLIKQYFFHIFKKNGTLSKIQEKIEACNETIIRCEEYLQLPIIDP